MKQYESVFFRHREMNSAEYLEVDGCGLTESAGPVIVLTIEELRELWNAGAQHGYESDFGGPAPDFSTYIQSKGLTIKQQ